MSKGIKRLFWDLETSPNIGFFWRSGYKQTIQPDSIIDERAIICMAYKWEGTHESHVVEWNDGDDKEICEKFAELAEEADEIVAHNGNKFDLPWINTRNLFHGLPPLALPTPVDTLKMARNRFYFNSNKLDYIAQFLGVEGKHETNFDLWKRIVLHNDPEAMAQMSAYCMNDVIILEKVYHKLREYEPMARHVGAHIGNGRWSCPQCGSQNVKKNKSRTTPMGMERHEMFCKDCGRHYSIANPAFKQYQEYKLLTKPAKKVE
jgi:hypothetical protein